MKTPFNKPIGLLSVSAMRLVVIGQSGLTDRIVPLSKYTFTIYLLCYFPQ